MNLMKSAQLSTVVGVAVLLAAMPLSASNPVGRLLDETVVASMGGSQQSNDKICTAAGDTCSQANQTSCVAVDNWCVSGCVGTAQTRICDTEIEANCILLQNPVSEGCDKVKIGKCNEFLICAYRKDLLQNCAPIWHSCSTT